MRIFALCFLALASSPLLAQSLGGAPLPSGGFVTPAPLGEPQPDAIAPAPAAKPKPKKKVAAAPVQRERVVAKDDPRPSLDAGSLNRMQEAAARYLDFAQKGEWPQLPERITLAKGVNSPLVAQLRERLAAEGDLPADHIQSTLFDGEVAGAVKRFQARHALARNGIVSGPTLAALRVTASERAHQLSESARRLTARHFPFGQRYVVVNIPSASVEAVENGQVMRRYVAVVGKSERASPEVETRITNVNFNPTWTVPTSIIKKDIIPKMRKDPGYLAKAKIRIFGASGNEVNPAAIDWNTERAVDFTLRQDPGSGNSLGQIRIDMPNRDAVYMHDTPSKRLFLRDDRFHSSGCVRVEGVRDFVQWLLEGNGHWDKAAIDASLVEPKRKDVRLSQAIPVIWTYLTGYVTEDGIVHFREDVYGRDHQTQNPANAQLARNEDAPTPKAKARPVAASRPAMQAASAQERPMQDRPMQDRLAVRYNMPPPQSIDP